MRPSQHIPAGARRVCVGWMLSVLDEWDEVQSWMGKFIVMESLL